MILSSDTRKASVLPHRGFSIPFYSGRLKPKAGCRLDFSIQPFANVIRNYTCRDGDKKRDDLFHRTHPLSLPVWGWQHFQYTIHRKIRQASTRTPLFVRFSECCTARFRCHPQISKDFVGSCTFLLKPMHFSPILKPSSTSEHWAKQAKACDAKLKGL